MCAEKGKVPQSLNSVVSKVRSVISRAYLKMHKYPP